MTGAELAVVAVVSAFCNAAAYLHGRDRGWEDGEAWGRADELRQMDEKLRAALAHEEQRRAALLDGADQ